MSTKTPLNGRNRREGGVILTSAGISMVTVITLIFFTFWLGSYNLKDQRLEIANVEFKEFIQQRLSAKLLEELSDSINNRSSAAGLNASSQSAGMGSGSNDGNAGPDNANNANRAGFDGFAPESWVDFLKEIQAYVQDNPGGLFTLTNPTVFFNDDGTSKITATNDCPQDGPRPLDTYMYTPNGLRKLQLLEESGINVCVALPGSVCVDSCTGEVKVHRKCSDTSRLNFEQDPSSYEEGEDVRSRYEVENHCPAEDEIDFTQTTTYPSDPTREIVMDPFFYVQKLLEPVRVCVSTGGDEMICEYVEVNLTIPAPPVEPRPAAACSIGGHTLPHGPTNVILYRKKDQYNLHNCEPQAQRAKLNVICNDGKFIIDGNREISGQELNTYSLVYEPCDCNSPAGLIPHNNSRIFYGKADNYDCNNRQCPSAVRMCNDKYLSGPGNYVHPNCVDHTYRCLNVLLPQVRNPSVCSSIIGTAVLDQGNKSLCEVVGTSILGADAIVSINSGICELGARLSYDDRDRDGINEYYGQTLQHYHHSFDGGNRDILKASSDLAACVNLGNYTGVGNRLNDTTGAGNTDSNVSDVAAKLSSRFGVSDAGLKVDYDVKTEKEFHRNPYSFGDMTDRELNALKDTANRAGSASGTFRSTGTRYSQITKVTVTKKKIAEIWKSNHWVPVDFLACVSSCFKINYMTFNSPIIISLDGLMPKGAVDARFSYDGKTVVDTKWPMFDAAEQIGFLAYDFNGNGIIDDGTELFGEYTGGERFQHGYDALSYFFDGNGDGVVTGTELEGLMMWKDLNGDGKGSADELTSILSYGVTELDSGKNTDAARIEMEGGVASPVSLERGVVWRDENNQEQFGASFDVWYTKKEE